MDFKRQDFTLGGHTAMGTVQFTPPFKASEPMRNEARFVHVIRGNSKLYFPNGKLELRCGDSALMKTDNFVNDWQTVSETPGPYRVLVLILNPEVLRQVYGDTLPLIFNDQAPGEHKAAEKLPFSPTLRSYSESLVTYTETPELITEEFLKLKVRELVQVLQHADTDGRIGAMLSDLFKPKEVELADIVHSHLLENLSLNDLAFFAGMSVSTFKRRFQSVFGTSPTRYIKTKRLEKAAQLIRTSDQRISDIAYDCGFNDLSYFTRSFGAMFDHSPTAYRKLEMS